MNVSEQIKVKEFTGKTMKDAYLSCCKWLSSNVIAINNSENITYKMQKIEHRKDGVHKIKLTLYVTVNEDEIKTKHCEICKEVTGSFFMKENKYMCESCKMIPYRNRVLARINIIKDTLKGKVI